MAVFTKRSAFIAATCLIGIAAFSVLFFTLGYQEFIAPHADIRELRAELAPYLPPPIHYKGTQYEIVHGVVTPAPARLKDERAILRIAEYALHARLDPRFAIEGVDLSLFRENIEHMEASATSLAHFYPVAFLRELAALEEARRALIHEGSDETVNRYDEALSRALAEYDSYLVEAAAAIKGANARGNYFMWGGTINQDTYLGALNRLSLASEDVASHREARMDCYLHGNRCRELQTPTIAFDTRTAPAPSSRITEHEAIFDAYYSASEDAYEPVDTRPIIALYAPACEPRREPSYYKYWLYTDTLERQAVRLENLEDIYLTLQEGNNPYHVFLREQGLTYEHQPSGNFYLCPESGDDFGRIAALGFIYDRVKMRPLADAIPELTETETALLEAAVLDEATVGAYLEALSGAITREGEAAFERAAGDESVLHAFELFNIWNGHSAGLDYALGSMAFQNTYIKTIARVTEFDPWFMYTARGYFSILLLPYNKSLVRDEARIHFFSGRMPLDLEIADIETYRTGRLASLSPAAFLDFFLKNRIDAQKAREMLDLESR